MSNSITDNKNKKRLNRNRQGIMRLEPRVMFDGAGAVDAIAVMTVADVVDYVVPPAVDEMDVVETGETAFDFTEVDEQAKVEILAYLSGDDAKDKLFSILHGNQSEPSADWLERAEQLMELLSNGEFEVNFRFLTESQMPGIFAGFSAEGPDGEQTIFINVDWWNQAEPQQRLDVLVEEYGHSFDHFLNPGSDTIGDEGEAFSAAVFDKELNFLEQARIAVHNDYATIVVEGEELVIETANFSFVNAYEMVYDLNNDGQINNFERWAEKEQNTHNFNATPLGQVGVLDDKNSRYFSGNDVSAIGLNIAGTDYFGWISRPIKSNGIVRGFYFWADDDFVDLATAQADGNTDGDRDVRDNRGFLLVLDQTWFDQQIQKTQTTYAINNTKDGNLGSIQVAVVGSSSDRVDSALNALIVDNSAPVANPDLLSGNAGTTITGNVLTNDADADNDILAVTEFVVGGQLYTVQPGDGTTVMLDGLGSLTIKSNGDVSFNPVPGYSGTTPTVTYTITDGEDAASSVLLITVNEVNAPPVSTNDTLTVDAGSPKLLGLDDFGDYSDANGDPLSLIRITGLPATGMLELKNNLGDWVAVTENQQISAADINAGRLRYTTDVVAEASIGFSVSDGKDYSISNYMLVITVNEGAPVAGDVSADAAIELGVDVNGDPVGSSSTGSLLPNGSSLTLTFIGNTPVADVGITSLDGIYGTLTVEAGGSFSYSPNNAHPEVDALNISGSLTESFSYIVANSEGITASAMLVVRIDGSNDAPIANRDATALKELDVQHASGHFGTVTGNVLSNDTDVDNDDNTLQVVIGDGDTIGGVEISVAASATSPIDAAATEFEATRTSGAQLHNSNGGFGTVLAQHYVVLAGGTTPLKASNGTDDLLVWRVEGSGNNARLGFNDPAAFYSLPAGTIFGAIRVSDSVLLTSQFTVAITTLQLETSSDIILTSMPSIPIEVDYVVTGTGIPANTTVIAVNDNVITLSQAVQIENRELIFSAPDNGSAPVAGAGEMLLAGEHGYLRIAQDGSYTYTLTDNSLVAGQTVLEIFTYKATDGINESNETTLTITVNGTSGAPGFTVTDDTFTTNEDEQLTGNLLANDNGATTLTSFTWGDQPGTVGVPLTIVGIGTLTVQSNGWLVFDAAQDYDGLVPVITYTASMDDTSEEASATATITITPVNDEPTSSDDAISVAVNTQTLLTPSDFGNYQDADGDPLQSIKITALPTQGTLQKLVAGEWFTVEVNDEFTVTEIAEGKLRYATAADAGNSYDALGFKVNDGTTDSLVSYTLTVNVFEAAAQLGDPPANAVPGAQTTANFVPLALTGVSVDDPNDDIATVTLSVAKGTLIVTVDGGYATDNGASKIVLSGTKAEINAMLATLVYTPNQGSVGQDALRIHTVDHTDRSATDFVTIDVTADTRPLTIIGTFVNEASPYLIFQVSGEAGSAGQLISLELAETVGELGYATVGQDVLPIFDYFDGTAWQIYTSGSLVAIPANETTLLVRVAVLQDSVNEGAETLKLIARNTNNDAFDGNGVILDDGTGLIFTDSNSPDLDNGNTLVEAGLSFLDDDRPIAVNNIAVNEASPYAVFTVTGADGQTVRLALEAGTARFATASPATDGSEDVGIGLEIWSGSAWIDYTPGQNVIIDTTGILLVRTTIVNDDVFEGQEGFSLAVTRLSVDMTTVRGIASIYDDGTGDIFLPTNITGSPNAPEDDGYPGELDDDRDIAFVTSDVHVNEGSNFVVFTLSGDSGQTVVLELLNAIGLEYGQASIPTLDANGDNVIKVYMGVDSQGEPIWEAYDPTRALPTFNDAGKLFIAVDIRAEQDDIYEGPETFQLKATLAQQTFDEDLMPNEAGWITNIESSRSEHSVIATATIWDDGSSLIFTGNINEETGTPDTTTDNLEDDSPGLSIDKTVLFTSEDGTTDSFTVSLDSEPTSNVTISITGLDVGEGNLSSTTLTFTPENWSVPQTVTVSGVDDDLVDGNQTYELTLTASSDDPNYANMTAAVTVTNSDNETAPNPTLITGDISSSVAEDAVVTGTLTAVDLDGLDATAPYAVSGNPGNGTASIDINGNWTYTPNPDWSGSDSFIVTVTDALGNETTQTISITVAPVQDAFADLASTPSGQPVIIDVLENDTFDGAPISISALTSPANGTAFLNANGTITYTANAGFVGTDTFTYTAGTPGGTPETITVTVTVGKNVVVAPPIHSVLPPVPEPVTASTQLPSAPATESASSGMTTSWISQLFDSMSGTAPWHSFNELFSSPSEGHRLSVNRNIPDFGVGQNGEVSFTIPVDTFGHTDPLARVEIVAIMADGSPLPNWLRFEPATGQIIGTAPKDYQGELQVRIVARDSVGRQAETLVRVTSASAADNVQADGAIPSSQIATAQNYALSDNYVGLTTSIKGFAIAVDSSGMLNGAHALNVARAIPDQVWSGETELLLFVIPVDAFIHTDSSAEVVLHAEMVDGSGLPAWLEFDPGKGEFRGEPPEDFEGELLIKVIARDQEGRSAETMIRIRIEAKKVESSIGRPGLAELLHGESLMAWKAERDQLINMVLQAGGDVDPAHPQSTHRSV